jgi:hypothetical protein
MEKMDSKKEKVFQSEILQLAEETFWLAVDGPGDDCLVPLSQSLIPDFLRPLFSQK